MPPASLAELAREGDADALRRVCSSLLLVRPDNVIPRPWGGRRLFAYKGVEEPPGDQAYGEVFEVSADRRDEESRQNPSTVELPDGSELELVLLLDRAAREILGPRLFDLHGPNLPLLPKTLDVKELLSVQAHPPGHPEAYLILDADPGATLRLGFRENVAAADLQRTFRAGREAQEALLERLVGSADLRALQARLGAAFARGSTPDELLDQIRADLEKGTEALEVRVLLSCLEGAWRQSLELLAEVPAVPGTVIFNATTPDAHSAEVHALGNPEQREVLILEIRRPAPTYRAWDHVRFPLRRIEITKAIEALSLRARAPESFIAERVEVRPRTYRTATCEAFEMEHLVPTRDEAVVVPALETVQTLHTVRGRGRVETEDGRPLAGLERGRSAVVPAVLGAWRLVSESDDCEVVRVHVPAGERA